MHSGEECVGVWRQINASSVRLQVEDSADERWVLVGKAIVLLPRPGAGLDIVDATYSVVPFGFPGLSTLLAFGPSKCA